MGGMKALLGDDPSPLPPSNPPARDAIEEGFRQFHQENPEVYIELVKLARQMKARGREHYGIGALFEVVRFHRALTTTDPEFKLNNNYRALYSRLIMERERDLAGFFETRVRASEKAAA